MPYKTFKHKSSSVTILIFLDGKRGVIQDFESKKKQKGHGTKALNKALKYADKKNIKLSIEANRFGKGGFSSNKELAKFYARFGFKKIKDQPVFMERN